MTIISLPPNIYTSACSFFSFFDKMKSVIVSLSCLQSSKEGFSSFSKMYTIFVGFRYIILTKLRMYLFLSLLRMFDHKCNLSFYQSFWISFVFCFVTWDNFMILLFQSTNDVIFFPEAFY